MESALTLPLMVFLMLGTMQLFMMMHARVIAQYAAYRATRSGSLNHGNCTRMTHAALLSLMPSIEPFARPGGTPVGLQLAQAFARHGNNTYSYLNNSEFSGTIVWLVREQPLVADVLARSAGQGQEQRFDQPGSGDPMRLELRLIYWFPMHVPFANWVMSRMFMANYGLRNYTAQNPLSPQQKANWGATGKTLDAEIAAELMARNTAGEFVFPIEASYSMRMMTPAKTGAFLTQNCPPTPNSL